MKKSIMSAILFLVASTMLSGCIFPHWGHGHGHGRDHDGYRGDGHRGDGHRDEGRRGGSGRRY